eukprot:363550-Chlamydomonas_euryale.AAC.5
MLEATLSAYPRALCRTCRPAAVKHSPAAPPRRGAQCDAPAGATALRLHGLRLQGQSRLRAAGRGVDAGLNVRPFRRTRRSSVPQADARGRTSASSGRPRRLSSSALRRPLRGDSVRCVGCVACRRQCARNAAAEMGADKASRGGA